MAQDIVVLSEKAIKYWIFKEGYIEPARINDNLYTAKTKNGGIIAISAITRKTKQPDSFNCINYKKYKKLTYGNTYDAVFFSVFLLLNDLHLVLPQQLAKVFFESPTTKHKASNPDEWEYTQGLSENALRKASQLGVYINQISKIPYEDSLIVNQELSEEEVDKLDMGSVLKAAFSARKRSNTRVTEQKVYVRDPYISVAAKRIADGKCQLCECSAPFKDKNGNQYLESHHIIWLSDGGPDIIENAIALCPNCHRKMHILNINADVELLKRRNATNLARVLKENPTLNALQT